MTHLIPHQLIDEKILVIRDRRVLLDHDLAKLYGVKTYRLNEQVKRNSTRFPEDFMFRLTMDEKAKVIANCDHLQNLKYSPTLPYAFTEHGAVMVATILNTEVAIRVSVQIVRAFIHLREYALSHADLSHKIAAMEKKYDGQFKIVFDAIRRLIGTPTKPRRPIGFRQFRGDNT